MPGLLQTINGNKGFRRIIYYPVVIDDNVKAVFEIAYIKNDFAQKAITDTVKDLSLQFKSHLNQQSMRIRGLCLAAESVIKRRNMVQV